MYVVDYFVEIYLRIEHMYADLQLLWLLQKKAEGHELYEQVFYHLDLVEKDYFGLQYTDHYNVPVSIARRGQK